MTVVNWSPDSRWIVTGARDNMIRVFDIETGSIVCKPLTGHTNTPTMLAFRPSSVQRDLEVVSGKHVCLTYAIVGPTVVDRAWRNCSCAEQEQPDTTT